MIIKLNLSIENKENQKKHNLLIERNSDIEKDLIELFKFFDENVEISRIRRLFHKYYQIKTSNLPIIISFLSTILEIIPESIIIKESKI